MKTITSKELNTLSVNSLLELLNFYNMVLLSLTGDFAHISDYVPDKVFKTIATEKNKIYNEIERREAVNLM